MGITGAGADAGYTVHADAAVRQAATDVLRRSMKALPGYRNEILLGMTLFLGRLSEDHSEVRVAEQHLEHMDLLCQAS
jgi:hypothetical protein